MDAFLCLHDCAGLWMHFFAYITVQAMEAFVCLQHCGGLWKHLFAYMTVHAYKRIY